MTDNEPKAERPRFRPPRMTTEQRDAIAEPVKGWIRDTDTDQVEVFNGTEWVPVPEPKDDRPRSKKGSVNDE